MPAHPSYSFGPFALDPAGRSLTLHGQTVALRPKTFELLECFLERPGRLVTKHELIAALWPHGDVTEQNLAQQVFLLRAALSDQAPRQAFIVTVPGRGYRFVAPIDVRPARDVPHTDVQRLYLRGRYHWEKRTRSGLAEAQACFERAIALDPSSAPALSGLASTYMLRGEFLHETTERAFPAARRMALRALELDPAQPEAHTVLGDVALFYDRDAEGADRHLSDALHIDPRYRTARLFHAWLCLARDRLPQARLELESALTDAPYDLPLQTALGVVAMYAGEYDEAVTQLRFILDLEPNWHLATYYLAAAHAVRGEYEAALAVLGADESDEYCQGNAAFGAFAAHRLGDLARATAFERVLDRSTARGEQLSVFNRALALLGRGDRAGALSAVAAASAGHDPWLIFIPGHPIFKAELGSQPRFSTTMQRIELGRDSAYGT